MADNRQFGNPKAPQFGDKISPGGESQDAGHCTQCEAMLADALDGTLSPADQAIFDAHMALCGPCSQMLAQAKRGAAWLEMLRDPRPEPPAHLLEKIIAQTSGVAVASAAHSANPAMQPAPSFGTVADVSPVPLGKVLPFRTRVVSALRSSGLGHAMLQPRLAMTAAMAFFSIALTLSLTGVRLQDLRAADLRPSSLKRGFYSAKAGAVQYYEGLRVVYELESRVHDLQSESEANGQQSTPSSSTPSQQAPASSPSQQQQKQQPSQQPDQQQNQPANRPAPGPGSSRRETPNASFRLVAASSELPHLRKSSHDRLERALA